MIPPLPLCFDHLSVGPTSLLKNTYAPDETMNDSSTPRNSVIDGGAGTYIVAFHERPGDRDACDNSTTPSAVVPRLSRYNMGGWWW